MERMIVPFKCWRMFFDHCYIFLSVDLPPLLSIWICHWQLIHKTMSLNRPSCRHTPRLGSVHTRSCSTTDPSPSRELRVSTAEPSTTTRHFTAKFEFPTYGGYWWHAGGVIEWSVRMSQKTIMCKMNKTQLNSARQLPKFVRRGDRFHSQNLWGTHIIQEQRSRSTRDKVDSAFHPPWDGKMSISLRAE